MKLRHLAGRWYLQIGSYVGLRVWLAHWILRGVARERDRLREEMTAEMRQLRARVCELEMNARDVGTRVS